MRHVLPGGDFVQKYIITIAYDGTDFHGWQLQIGQVSVAQCLQDAFHKVFGHSISLVGASRTDTGVHALGQVAHFSTPLEIPPERILKAWNGRLPATILIRDIKPVDARFHVHRGVLSKTYLYHIFLKRPLPFYARYGWHYEFIDHVDINVFEQALPIYLGTHDFAAFCAPEPNKSTIRTVTAIQLTRLHRWHALRISVTGPAFGRHQIRRMIGYALDVSRRPHLGLDYLRQILASKNPEQALQCADGSGLCLQKIIYGI